MKLVYHLNGGFDSAALPPPRQRGSRSLSADAAPHMQRWLKHPQLWSQLLSPVLMLLPITDNYSINTVGCCFPPIYMEKGRELSNPAVTTFPSALLITMTGSDPWLVAPAVGLRRFFAAWLPQRGFIILIKPSPHRHFPIRNIKSKTGKTLSFREPSWDSSWVRKSVYFLLQQIHSCSSFSSDWVVWRSLVVESTFTEPQIQIKEIQ